MISLSLGQAVFR